jgi:MFS family permease
MSQLDTSAPRSDGHGGAKHEKLLFWACFLALIATAFGFVVRAMVIGSWGKEFGLNATQQGEIFGVGLWPFALSIILFSLVIDRIGYGTAMVFAFVCHVASAIITIWLPYHMDPYWALYIGTFIVALGNGTVEAVINPVVASTFPREKTKWLNMLHAGWPGGLVIGGVIAIAMGPNVNETTGEMVAGLGAMGTLWQWKVGLILLPTVGYALMMLGCKFPVSERVAAGISYKEMLKEFGMGGAFIVSFLMVSEVGRVFGFQTWMNWVLIIGLTIGFGAWVGFAIGRPLFLFMLLIMVPLATTELGTDSWITELMTPAMTKIGIAAGWVLVYTSFIMMVLRFFAGPIVHRLSPLGLLATAATVAAIGLILLSQVQAAAMILLAATVYGLGKTFFWPTMLGVVSEQSPKGGALTLNATGGVGMLGVGVVGAVFLGYIQDTTIEGHLAKEAPAIHAKVIEPKKWVFGELQAVDPKKIEALPADEQTQVNEMVANAKQRALATVAIFPGIMLVCYLILIGYFKSKGGYQAVHLDMAGDESFPSPPAEKQSAAAASRGQPAVDSDVTADEAVADGVRGPNE